MGSSGTQRQITVGFAEIPLSEASSVVSLQVTSAGGATLVARNFAYNTNSKTITTTKALDLWVGFDVSASVPNGHFPSGTVITSITNDTTFEVNNFPSSRTLAGVVTTAKPARNIVVTGLSPILQVPDGTAGLYVGQPLNNPRFLAGTVIVTIDSSTQVTVSNPALAQSAVTSANFWLPANSRVLTLRSDSSTVTTSTTADLNAGVSLGSPVLSIFPANPRIVSIVNGTSFTMSTIPILTTINTSVTSYQIAPRSVSIVSASTTVTVLAPYDTSDIVIGSKPNLTGIPVGATVVSITNATQFVISAAATATTASVVAFNLGAMTLTTVFGSNTVTLTAGNTTSFVYVGMRLNLGVKNGFPEHAVVSSIINTTSFTMSSPALASRTGIAFGGSVGKFIDVVGGSSTVTLSNGSTNEFLYVGMPFYFGIGSPIGSTILSFTSTTITLSTAPVITQNVTVFLSTALSKSLTIYSNSKTVNVATTQDLWVGQTFTSSGTRIKPNAFIESIVNETTFTLSEFPLLFVEPETVSEFDVASKTITVSSGDNIATLTTGNTSDISIGMVLNASHSSLVNTQYTVATITDSTHFTTVENSVISMSEITLTPVNEDYLMFTDLRSGLPYKVPAGKKFIVTGYYPNSTAPIVFGKSTGPLVADAGGRKRSHIEPVGAVYFAHSSSDYTYNADLVKTNLVFTENTYPFIRTKTINFYPIITGVEV